MNRKLILLLSCLFLSLGFIHAQTQASGTVVDETGEAVVGATVVAKGTTVGTVTDLDGKFELSMPAGNNTLVFSLVGMKSIEKRASANMHLVMESDATQLKEVEIQVAYGAVRRGAFTGSADVVSAEEIKKIPTLSIDKALQGTTAGLQITSKSGQPGAASFVRLRGVGSINGDSSPLFVIDGVPISSSSKSSGILKEESEFSKVSTTYNPLSALNNEDIESITILKDASAASLYGSRAANGVIIITTKKGSAEKTKINFKSQFGFSKLPSNGYNLTNSAQLYKHYMLGFYNDAYKTNGYNDTDKIPTATDLETLAKNANVATAKQFAQNPYNHVYPLNKDGNLINNAQLMVDTDWMKEVYRTGASQQYDLSIDGGNKATQYFLSAGYLKQKGVAIVSELDRYSMRANITTEARKWLSIGVNSTFSVQDQNTPSADAGGSSPLMSASFDPSIMPLYKLNNNFEIELDPITDEKLYNFNNPRASNMNGVALAYLDIYKSRTYRGLLSPWITIKPIDHLSWKTQLAYDFANLDEKQWYNRKYGNASSPTNGRLYRYSTWNITSTFTSTLNYDFKLNEIHNLSAMAGYELTNNTLNQIFANGYNFSVFDIVELGDAAGKDEMKSFTYKDNLISYFGNVNYSLYDKYYASASIRTDGSSRFGKNNKYGTFWSVGANWRFSNEDFLASTKGWLSDSKLRVSYGTTGSKDGIGRYASLGLFESGRDYNGVPGIARDQLANPGLKWEEARFLNIGLDFNILHRFSGTLEYFNKKSKDLLLRRPLAPSTGNNTIWMNMGGLKNNGVELTLNSQNIDSKEFKWETSLNLASISNKIFDYPDDETIQARTIWTNGYSLYEFYMPEWAGVDKATGAPMWYKDILDADENVVGREITNKYSQASKYKLGSSIPKLYGGLNNTFEYKRIDFSFLFTYSFGGKVYDQNEEFYFNDGNNPAYQMVTEALDAWTPTNTNAKNPIFSPVNKNQSNAMSSRFLHKADFIKMKNITIGYSLPKNITKSTFIDGVRLFGALDNLYVWKLDSSFTGYDPELGGVSGDIDKRGSIPLPRTILFGISLDFK